MIELQSRPLMRVEMELRPPLDVGATPLGRRRVVDVAAGSFTGERLRGRILSGADWLLLRADGSFQQDVRLTLEAHDGALILMSYRGVRHANAEVSARLARGEPVDRSEFYLRTAPFFETAAPAYAWLNQIASVAMGERTPSGVGYDLFEVL